jgi:hypothetical protein
MPSKASQPAYETANFSCAVRLELQYHSGLGIVGFQREECTGNFGRNGSISVAIFIVVFSLV